MRKKIKLRYLLVAAIVGACGITTQRDINTNAESCPDLRVVFARGSGGERWNDQNYLSFKDTIEEKLKTTSLDYEFIDLDYPAMAVGIDNLSVTLGAFFGGGEAYEFGESVSTGVKNLTRMVNKSCPNTKYVIGGYSQGAMVISKSLNDLDPDKIIYAATFGDPKIYLPEGAGIMPIACHTNAELSDYRAYVPDCHAYKGLLGAYEPYRPEALAGKVGTWCNKRDIFCSSYLVVDDHVAYVKDNLYEDASRVIFDKITKAFNVENHISSPHDTAILIDSTGSMSYLIDQFKAEALRLAKETLDAGGRVALYDYRDLNDPYEATEYCNFETCTLEVFTQELNKIEANGGGDNPESLLSSSFKVMKALNWKQGTTKSLVVLTDDTFLHPDRDGVTMDQVVKLSKTIDPVNFYIITLPEFEDDYSELAQSTGGMVVTDFDELSLLTDYIMDRYDSLPRVEEDDEDFASPYIIIEEVSEVGNREINIKFKNSGISTMVVLNDAILGITTEQEITIKDLDSTVTNVLTLVPMSKERRGEAVTVTLELMNGAAKTTLKAPNTGQV